MWNHKKGLLQHFGCMLLSVWMISCVGSQKENASDDASDSIAMNAAVMRNGLLKEMSGQWINTSLFDSTIARKTLAPWLDEFYGDLYLEITESDTMLIKGTMDGGETYMKTIDSCSFTFFERVDHPVFSYSAKTDLITEKVGKNTIVYRRVKKEDPMNIIDHEELFNGFFISHFFTDDYFKQKPKPEIKEIWNGFLTYRPFTFDAIAIENEKGETDWYGWKFKGDTLELYNTTYTEDEDSGFLLYTIGTLKEQYIKNK